MSESGHNANNLTRLIPTKAGLLPKSWFQRLVRAIIQASISGVNGINCEFTMTTQRDGGRFLEVIVPEREVECKAFRLTRDSNTGEWCVSFGKVIIPPGIQPSTPVVVTVEGQEFNDDGDAICLGSYDPDSQCLMFCFEFRGGDAENNIPAGQAISFDIQAFPFGSKPADVEGAAAEYDFDGDLESPEENGVIYYPFYDPRPEGAQEVCQNMYLHSCGGRVFQFTPYAG